jgi:hypothetical protein
MTRFHTCPRSPGWSATGRHPPPVVHHSSAARRAEPSPDLSTPVRKQGTWTRRVSCVRPARNGCRRSPRTELREQGK